MVTALLSPEVQLWKEKQIIEKSLRLPLYQLYVVEKWIPDRTHAVKTMVAYTGNKEHEITVALVDLGADAKSSLLTRMESEDLAKPVSIRSKSRDATLYVTQLSSVPSQLTLVQVPYGDYYSHIRMFHLQINLRRMACSGRSALSFAHASDAQRERFNQIYKTNSRLEFDQSVFELVKLVQAALCLFGLLDESRDLDGLLCDASVAALTKFNQKFGPYELDIQGSMCDPALCAALISKVLSYRNKLSEMGVQCPKNPFADREGFAASVMSYQKSHKLEQTGILTDATLDRIRDSYYRTSPPLGVKKALKSRFDDNHHKDIETSNLEELLFHAHLDMFKTLWNRKNRNPGVDVLQESANIAENLIQGGKEFGRNILKNVSNKAPRVPEKYRDSGAKNARSISKIEGFVDRATQRKQTKLSPSKANADETSATSDVSGSEQILFQDVVVPITSPRATQRKRAPTDSMLHDFRKEEVSLVVESSLTRKRAATDPSLFEIDWDDPELQAQLGSLFEEQTQADVLMEELRNIKTVVERLNEEYSNNWQNFSEVEQLLNEMMAENRLFQTHMDQLDVQNAKLHYEVASLEEKYREVDEIIENISEKMQDTEVTLNQMMSSSRPR